MSNTKRRRPIGAGLLLGVSTFTAVPALAQPAPVLTKAESPATPAASPTPAANPATDAGEIIVTAQKRPEKLQKAPLNITVLDTTALSEHNVHSFQDYAALIPSLTFDTLGPGQAEIYFRGISNGSTLAAGPLPTVGIYLDEQPVTTIGQALDVHIYDIARVEALAGPQGTLYGASSEAGTLRIITNKPDPRHFSAGVDGTLQSVAHGGDIGGITEGFVNIPLSEDIAVRLVGFDELDPGYIDNIPSNDQVYEPSGFARDNTAIARNAINHTHTYGGRALLKADFGAWSIMPSVMYQHLLTHGTPAYRLDTGYLENTRFFKESYRDSWTQAALTVLGKLGPLDLTYAGAWLTRKTQYISDYSDYSYYYDQYYTQNADANGTNYAANFVDNNGNIINNAQLQVGTQRYHKLSQELRVALPKTHGFQFVAGLFYQRQTNDWKDLYEINGLADALSVTGYPGVNYANIQYRTDRDVAAFGQASYDITSKLTLTGGLRAYRFNNNLFGFFGYGLNNAVGSTTGEAQCDPATIGNTPGAQPCNNVGGDARGSGVRHKLNLSWQATPDKMLYATWSTGFRPGGVNRLPNVPPYQAENLSNVELGAKTRWLDHHLRINGDVFLENLSNAQFEATSDYNGIEYTVNAGRARSWGAEGEIEVTPTRGLTLTASGAHVTARLRSNLCKYYDPSFTCAGTDTAGNANATLAPAGTRFPITPLFKAAATARYEFGFGAGKAHLQATLHHESSFTSVIATDASALLGGDPAYTSADFAVGYENKGWSAELVAANAFNSHADVYRYASCTMPTCRPGAIQVIPLEPRLISLRVGYRF